MTEWDNLTDEDRAWALVPDLVDDPDKCSVCGGDKRVCQDPDAQHAWVVEARRCYKSLAVAEWMERRKNEKHAHTLHLTARIDDSRRKSARTK